MGLVVAVLECRVRGEGEGERKRKEGGRDMGISKLFIEEKRRECRVANEVCAHN